MSSKIESITLPYELLELIEEELPFSDIRHKVTEILAAPVVEPHPVELYVKLHEIAVEAAVSATMRYSYMPKTINEDWKPHTWVIAAMHKAVEFYTAPPELAELQATISELSKLLGQARGMVNGASDEWHDSVTKVLGHE